MCPPNNIEMSAQQKEMSAQQKEMSAQQMKAQRD